MDDAYLVAILNGGGGDDAAAAASLAATNHMPRLPLDQGLAGIEAVAVDASPPFSALFTL